MLRLLALLLLSPSPPATESVEPERRRVECSLQFDISAPGHTSRVDFTALIPSSLNQRQTVQDVRFSRKPKEIKEHGDGRYARFEIQSPGESTRIEIDVTLEIADYDLEHARRSAKRPRSLTTKSRRRYLASEQFIEADAKPLRLAAKQIPGRSDLEFVEAAYAYVSDRMKPSGFTGADIGALTAFERGHGDCTEYADLMIALCRARKIPARYVEGFTTNWSDTPKHDWVEVYLKDFGWVPLDPLHGDRGRATFSDLETKYIYLTTERNDDRLEGHHYYSFRFSGDPVTVDDSFVIRSDEAVD